MMIRREIKENNLKIEIFIYKKENYSVVQVLGSCRTSSEGIFRCFS